MPDNLEHDPLFLTDEERDRILKLTDEHNRIEAVRMVLGGGRRYREFVAAEERQRAERRHEEARAAHEERQAEQAEKRDQELLDLLRRTNPDNITPPEDTDH